MPTWSVVGFVFLAVSSGRSVPGRKLRVPLLSFSALATYWSSEPPSLRLAWTHPAAGEEHREGLGKSPRNAGSTSSTLKPMLRMWRLRRTAFKV